MRIFVYELVTGGGLLGGNAPPSSSLFREARAMVTALAADFAAIEGVEVAALRDARLADLQFPGCTVHDVATPKQERDEFDRLAARSDWSVMIAPETDGALLDRATAVLAAGGRLLGPPTALIRLASDKHETALRLAAAGERVPAGRVLPAGEPLPFDFPYPAVLKPQGGAGSQEVRLVPGAETSIPPSSKPRRLERYHPGLAASVAVLCGPKGHVALPPCRQRLGGESGFAYLGGALPLDGTLTERATRLALAAISALEAPLGYIGVDLVLGDDPLGADDVVVEINPRLTTSYVGLRAATGQNLAAAMCQIASGQPVSLLFRSQALQYDADGTIWNAV